MASYTFYSDTSDGNVVATGTWAAIQAGTASLSTSLVSSTFRIGKLNSGGSNFYYQGFLGFDTSALPDTADVTSAVLFLSPSAVLGSRSWTLQVRTYDWGASVTTADYRTSSQWAALLLLATLDLSSGLTADTYYALSPYGTNLMDAISKTGFTRFVLAGDDFGGIAPPSETNYTAFFYSADNSGTTSDPKLEISTFEAPTFTPYVMWYA